MNSASARSSQTSSAASRIAAGGMQRHLAVVGHAEPPDVHDLDTVRLEKGAHRLIDGIEIGGHERDPADAEMREAGDGRRDRGDHGNARTSGRPDFARDAFVAERHRPRGAAVRDRIEPVVRDEQAHRVAQHGALPPEVLDRDRIDAVDPRRVEHDVRGEHGVEVALGRNIAVERDQPDAVAGRSGVELESSRDLHGGQVRRVGLRAHGSNLRNQAVHAAIVGLPERARKHHAAVATAVTRHGRGEASVINLRILRATIRTRNQRKPAQTGIHTAGTEHRCEAERPRWPPGRQAGGDPGPAIQSSRNRLERMKAPNPSRSLTAT